MEEQNIKILSSVNLTKPEAKVYLALVELKESKTGELCEKSGIPSSNIYKILDSLIKKGIVSYRVQNNKKIFSPSPPEVINELFKEKQEEVEKERLAINSLIEELKNKSRAEESHSKYKYYEGIKGVKSMWYELTSYLGEIPKGTITKIYTGKKEAYENLLAFYDEYHKERAKLGIKYKVIFPIGEIEYAKKRKKQDSEVRFLELENKAEWGIIGDKFFIQYITEKVPKAFLISDKIIAFSFEQVFDSLWKIAKQ